MPNIAEVKRLIKQIAKTHGIEFTTVKFRPTVDLRYAFTRKDIAKMERHINRSASRRIVVTVTASGRSVRAMTYENYRQLCRNAYAARAMKKITVPAAPAAVA